MKEFTFSYFAAKNSVSFDDFTVKVKIGPLIKKEFPFANLQHYYVFDNKDYRSVYLVYTDTNGKTKKVQVMSTPAEIGFTQLVEELNARIPQKSLNHLPEKEAFKMMKAANPKKFAPVLALAIITVIMIGVLFPYIRHYFDFGFAEATVQQVAGGALDTRNVKLTGYPLDAGVEETTTTTRNGSTSKSTSVFIPVVSEGWKEGDPVEVVLKFDKLSDSEYNDVLKSISFTGVIRNFAWEGISNDQVDFLKKNYNLNITNTPVLLEVTGKAHNDVWAIWVLIGTILLFGIIFVVTALRRR